MRTVFLSLHLHVRYIDIQMLISKKCAQIVLNLQHSNELRQGDTNHAAHGLQVGSQLMNRP